MISIMKENPIIRITNMSYFRNLKYLLITALVILVSRGQNAYSQTEAGLNELITKSLQNSQTVKASYIDYSIAGERVSEVKTNMMPHLNVSGDYKYYPQVPKQLMDASGLGGRPGSYMAFGTGIPWALGTTISLGQLIYSQEYITGVKLAHTGEELSGLLLRKSKEDIAYNVSSAFYNAQILMSHLSFIENNISNMEKLIATGELLYQNQMIKNSDVDKLKLSKTMLETQKETVAESYEEVINALKLLSGIPQKDELRIDNKISTNNFLPQDRFSPDRIELRLIEKKKELTMLERDKITASLIPTVSAYGIFNYTFYGKGGENSNFKGYPGSWFGIQFNWKLFDGLESRSKRQIKDLELKKLDLQTEQLNENVSMELKNATQQIKLQNTNIESRKEQLTLAEKIYEQTRLQFKEGVANITDVIQSDNSLREAQNNYLVSTINLLNAQLSWKKAAGKLLSF